MIDIHLINVTLASLGIGSGVAILIAATIMVLAAVRQHRVAAHLGTPLATASSGKDLRHEPARREPALR